jgi:hypothetical protein
MEIEYQFKQDLYKKECPEKHILDKIEEISELRKNFLYDDCRDCIVGKELHTMSFDEFIAQYKYLTAQTLKLIKEYYV